MYIDIAERINELGRQPYTSRSSSTVSDRILLVPMPFLGYGRALSLLFPLLKPGTNISGYGEDGPLWIGLEDDIRKAYHQNAEKVLMLEG